MVCSETVSRALCSEVMSTNIPLGRYHAACSLNQLSSETLASEKTRDTRNSMHSDSATMRGSHSNELMSLTGAMLVLQLRRTGEDIHILMVLVNRALRARGVANRINNTTTTDREEHPIVLIRLRGSIISHAIRGVNAIARIGVKTPCVREI